MAKQTLVSSEYTKKIRELLRSVSDEKGEVNLALLAQSPDSPDKWSFVVSAPWVDVDGPRASVAFLSTKLRKYLDREQLAAIERISVLRNDHRLIGTILQTLGLQQSLTMEPHLIPGFEVEDVRFPKAYVFVADPYPQGQRLIGSGSR